MRNWSRYPGYRYAVYCCSRLESMVLSLSLGPHSTVLTQARTAWTLRFETTQSDQLLSEFTCRDNFFPLAMKMCRILNALGCEWLLFRMLSDHTSVEKLPHVQQLVTNWQQHRFLNEMSSNYWKSAGHEQLDFMEVGNFGEVYFVGVLTHTRMGNDFDRIHLH